MMVRFYIVLFISTSVLSSFGVLSQETMTLNTATDTASGKVDEYKRIDPFGTGKAAVIETTPADCSPGIRCGFQVYDENTGQPSLPFIKYCNCAEGTECVQAGEDMVQRFFYYKCRKIDQPEVTVAFEESITETFSAGGEQSEDEATETLKEIGITNVPDTAEERDSSEVSSLKSRVDQIAVHNEL